MCAHWLEGSTMEDDTHFCVFSPGLALSSTWIFQCPWHSKVASMHCKFDQHIRRGAWTWNWAGLTALARDPGLERYWQKTGRLFRMYRGHINQRWAASIKVAEIHSEDPYLILTSKSAKFGADFDLLKHTTEAKARMSVPCCCICLHTGCKYDELRLAISGHWCCSVHRNCTAAGILCPHCARGA